MSRTDHHRPRYVQAADPLTPNRYLFHYHGIRGDEACTADGRARTNDPGRWRHASCGWELSYLPPPPGWYINFTGTRPERARDRRFCRDAAREWNTHGEVTPVEPDRRHRHRACWYWW